MPARIHRLVEVGEVGKAILVVGIVEIARRARIAHHVDVLAPAAIGHLVGEDVLRGLERIGAASPVCGVVGAQRNMPAAHRRMFRIGVVRCLLLVGENRLSIAFCFSDRSRYSSQAFCSFLGSDAMRSRVTGLRNHVHANLVG